MALSLRAILILHAALCGRRDFYCGERADGANLTCLNFADKRDLAKKHRLDLRGFKFKSEKIS